jgi:hypothetical protein
MDYVVARMQATGHTSPYNAAVPPVAHSIAIAADHRPPPVVSISNFQFSYIIAIAIMPIN